MGICQSDRIVVLDEDGLSDEELDDDDEFVLDESEV